MGKRDAVFPARPHALYREHRYSPAVRANGLLFVSGQVGAREDGTPGSGSYQGQPNAALVTNDQDFASCLEVQKTEATQKLRSFAQTPIQPGLYLRVTARVKAVSGNLPSVRIAAWAGDVSGQNVVGLPQTGASVALTSYGQVVTVSAIISPASRTGVAAVDFRAQVRGRWSRLRWPRPAPRLR